MNREAIEKLRLDKRLIHHRGWIPKAEREKLLEALPDVSDKIAPPEEEEPSAVAPAQQTVSDPAGESGAAREAVRPRVE